MNKKDSETGSLAKEAIRPEDLLGLPRQNVTDLIRSIDHGLPFDSIETMARITGLSITTLAKAVGIGSSTLVGRKKVNRLTSVESDRLISVADSVASSIGLFGGRVEATCGWLLKASPALGNVTPLHMIGSEPGRHEVKCLIGRLEHGVFS